MTRIAICAPSTPITREMPARSALAAASFPQAAALPPQCFSSDGHFAGPDDDLRGSPRCSNAPTIRPSMRVVRARRLWREPHCRGCAGPAGRSAAQDKTYVGYSDAGYLLGALYRQRDRPARSTADAGRHPPRRRRGGGPRHTGVASGGPAGWSRARRTTGVAFNLITLAMLCGTPLMPGLAGHVVMVEEVSEHLYAVDRLFFHLTAHLGGIAGLRLGGSATCRKTTVRSAQSERTSPATGAIAHAIPYLGRPTSATTLPTGSCPSGLPESARHRARANQEGSHMRAFVFPGQGSQKVGMGAELAEPAPPRASVRGSGRGARPEAVRADARRAGRRSDPDRERPARDHGQCHRHAARAGKGRRHQRWPTRPISSPATAWANTPRCARPGAFSLADTARLLKLRGQAMQAAVPVGVGAMCALLGADIDKAQALAEPPREGEVCTVANDNDPTQVVLSGHKARSSGRALVKDHGIKRGMLLPVSAPFHCPLMQPAADAMAEALEKPRRGRLRVPLFANVTAAWSPIPPKCAPAGRAGHRPRALARKRDRHAAPASNSFVELGGKVLGPMITARNDVRLPASSRWRTSKRWRRSFDPWNTACST
jgi:[acyl-carrier-protein] S-malonyltransferase